MASELSCEENMFREKTQLYLSCMNDNCLRKEHRLPIRKETMDGRCMVNFYLIILEAKAIRKTLMGDILEAKNLKLNTFPIILEDKSYI